jgi:hypothetical protein
VILPLAHVGHYLWVLYVVPIAIVVVGIVRSQLTRRDKNDSPGG